MERKLIGEIRTRQMRFLGHVIRKDGLENLAMTGKIEGKMGRGRKRMLWMTSLNAWIAERVISHQEVELIKKARKQRVVACHDHPRLRIWHLERETGSFELGFKAIGEWSYRFGIRAIKA